MESPVSHRPLKLKAAVSRVRGGAGKREERTYEGIARALRPCEVGRNTTLSREKQE